MERSGYEVTLLPVDKDGNMDVDDLVRALTPETLLVTIMHANNETGVIFPIERLSSLTKQTDPSIIFHTDATQTVGKLPMDLGGPLRHVDLLSFSGHKLHAPKGIGALYVKKGTPCKPFMLGGHQESGRRGGTENVPFIVALAKALELAEADRDEDEARILKLRDHLEEGIEKTIPYVQVNGRGAPRLPNTLNVSCHFIEGEGMLYQLSDVAICASSGSACTSGSLEPSHVLRALKSIVFSRSSPRWWQTCASSRLTGTWIRTHRAQRRRRCCTEAESARHESPPILGRGEAPGRARPAQEQPVPAFPQVWQVGSNEPSQLAASKPLARRPTLCALSSLVSFPPSPEGQSRSGGSERLCSTSMI
jgi:hypothetical protein